MSTSEQQRLRAELEAIISEHTRYGRKMAEEAFLENPRNRYNIDTLRPIIESPIARVLVKELAARDLPPIFAQVAGELAIAGFFGRYYELALNNLPLEPANEARPPSVN